MPYEAAGVTPGPRHVTGGQVESIALVYDDGGERVLLDAGAGTA